MITLWHGGRDIEQFSLMHMLGGMVLFLYGMQLTKNGLQLFAGDRLRAIIHNLTDNRIMGLGVGALTTGVIQSSTATTVMLVGFASAGLMTLRQAMGVILGADVGTTITVQIISLKLTDYALWMVIVGFLPMLLAKRKSFKYLGEVVLGFGFIFFGMGLMVDAAAPIKDQAAVLEIIQFLGERPIWGLAAAAALTAFLHSSAATLGLVLSLAIAGSMTLDAAIPMMLGANVGTCATALLSSVGSGVEGRRVAWAHLGFKVAGVILIFPLLLPFENVVVGFTQFLGSWLADAETTVARQVAWAHTIFNIGISVLFLPFIGPGAKLLKRLIPGDENGEGSFAPKYLDERALDTPSLAFGNATREMLRMAHIVQEMLDGVIDCFQQDAKLFRPDEDGLLEEISSKDDLVDLLNEEIKFYLTKLVRKELSEEQSQRELELITLTSSLENIGDVIDTNLLELARKRQTLSLVFSDEGWAEITDFHAKVAQNYRLGVAAYTNRDVDLAHKVLRHKKSLGDLEEQYRNSHIARLHAGLKETLETSSLHLDILTNLRRVNSYATRFAKAVLEQANVRRATDR